MNAARIVNLIHQTAVCHRPGHGVNLGIPDKASVLYIHTNDIALESGCAHKFLINPGAADHVNQTLYFCDALGLTDDGIKDDAAVIWVERHKPAVGLTDENARRRPCHLRKGTKRKRRRLALIVPDALACNEVKSRDAGVRRLHNDAIGTHQRRHFHVR